MCIYVKTRTDLCCIRVKLTRVTLHAFILSCQVRRIRTEVGINPVAKYTDSWDGSFADAEMELIRDLDADGGSRKKVYRIVKTLNKTLWCPDVETAAISSYDIKVLMSHNVKYL